MLEVARLIQKADSLQMGVDFVCFDAEDWGVPQWSDDQDTNGDSWALGAQYWAENPHKPGYELASASCSTWWEALEHASTRRDSRSNTP